MIPDRYRHRFNSEELEDIASHLGIAAEHDGGMSTETRLIAKLATVLGDATEHLEDSLDYKQKAGAAVREMHQNLDLQATAERLILALQQPLPDQTCSCCSQSCQPGCRCWREEP